MKSRLALILAVAAACSFAAGDAKAQYGYNGCGYGYGCGIYDMGNLYRVLANNVPYYSAFPPVYYSIPVPRTYGYSPFAYPPGVMTPEVTEAVAPMEIINPHVEPASTSEEKPADKVTQAAGAPTPMLVLNPYVSTHLAEASLAVGR